MTTDSPAELPAWASPCLQDLAQAASIAESGPTPRAGDSCPRCGAARLALDGVLNLACPKCGFHLGGGFT